MKPSFNAVLFDLDGTLADTAPDLAAAVNLMRTRRNLEPTSYAQLRANASGGARGLLHAGFGITPDDSEFEAMRVEFLNNYEAALCQQSRLFDGIAELLDYIQKQAIPWGIVTNKATRFTQPLVPLLKLQDAHCVISGDTTPHFKPHPAPLLEAAKRLNIAPQNCCYVGDDLRDIQAAQAAGMYSIAAGWGYCGYAEPKSWDADLLLQFPSELLKLMI
jgi:N-acetyl-D-muramate 6-phosphate phosphatase